MSQEDDKSSIVKDLLLSKKFLVALFATIGAVTAHLGWNFDPTTILVMMTPLLIYIGAQGWGADVGKEKAKIDAAAAIKIHATAVQLGATTRPTTNAQSEDKPALAVVTVSQETNP